MTTQSPESNVVRRVVKRIGARSSPLTGGIVRSRIAAALSVPAVAFAVLWLVAVATARIHVLDIQQPWSTKTWLVIIIVPAAFLIGGFAVRWPARALAHPRPNTLRPQRTPRKILALLVVVGYAELAREFATSGTVPLFSSQVDVARTSLNSGALELLTAGLTVAAVVAVTIPKRLLSRAALPDLALAAIGLLGFLLEGGRYAVVVPIAAGVVARSLYRRPPSFRTLVAPALCAVGLFSLIFYWRTGQELNGAFAQELYGRVLPGTPTLLVPLLPVHFALALNFTALAAIVSFFPHSMPFGHGVYDAYPLHGILHASSVSSVSAILTPPWTVSTLAGPMWADGGFVGVVIGCVITGGLTTAPYWIFRRTRTFSHALLAGYFFAIAVFCVYMNILTQFKDWVVVAGLMWALGRWMERRTPLASEPVEPDLPLADLVRAPPFAAGVSVLAVAAIAAGVVIVARRGEHRVQHPLPPVTALTTSDLPAGILNDPLATDPSLDGPDLIWSFSERAGRVYATPLLRSGAALVAGPREDLGLRPPGKLLGFDVGRWGASSREAAFVLTANGRTVKITAISLGATPGSLLAMAQSAPIGGVPGTPLQYLIASQPGTLPDLAVIDRGVGGAPASVQLYSGSSGYQKRVLDKQLPIGPLPSSQWTIALGSLESARPDLLIATRSATTRSGHLEIHVLRASADYQAFGEQAPLDLRASEDHSMRFLITHIHGIPALYGVEAASRAVVLLSLSPLLGYIPPTRTAGTT